MIVNQPHTIQVFEHQTIRLGQVINGICFDEAHYKALALYQEKQTIKYYSLVYNGVKFSHYVGIIQIGNLTIEILPKADQTTKEDVHKWQAVLLEMLAYCHFLKIESTGIGRVRHQSNAILNLYFKKFIDQLNLLFINGLPKQYLKTENNQRTLKGQLHLPKHLRKNGQHPERFYVKHQAFSYDHLFNQVLKATLNVLDNIPLQSSLKNQLIQLQQIFPKVTMTSISNKDFDLLFQTKKYQPYRNLLDICRLILMNFSPDIRTGRHHLFALLFDMNKLYEAYVFQQLKALENDDISVQRQLSKPFWQRRSIRPDLVLQVKDQRYVLDTKWKILPTNSPSMEDLKQLYIYCQYFNAQQGALLYPKVASNQNTATFPYHATPQSAITYAGQIVFLRILDEEGRLNKALGKELLMALGGVKN